MLILDYVYRFLYLSFFFFSSRRRHTRLQGDWSSDVCSSDLYFRVVGLDLVLVALVASGLHVGDGARVVLLPEIVAAEREVEPPVAPCVTRFYHLGDAR